MRRTHVDPSALVQMARLLYLSMLARMESCSPNLIWRMPLLLLVVGVPTDPVLWDRGAPTKVQQPPVKRKKILPQKDMEGKGKQLLLTLGHWESSQLLVTAMASRPTLLPWPRGPTTLSRP